MSAALKIPGSIRNEGLVYKKLKTPKVAPNLFKLHTLAAFIGPRGSGKTNAAVLLARRYLDDGSINRTFIISPTIDSNSILASVKASVEEYEETKAYNNIWKRWKLYVKGKGPALTIPEFNIMENNNFKARPKLPRPSPLLIIDDMSHSDLYTPSKKNSFINLCLRHRHLYKVGISIFMLVQTFKTGIPKCLRQNIQQFFLWPTHDMSQLDSMYEEFANLCTYEDFIYMFKKATKERHNFMTIDLNAPDPLLQFRKNFDEIIIPPELITEDELNEDPPTKKSKS